MEVESCFLCRKHNGQEATPPGGYIYQDRHWMICHAPPTKGPLGTLFIESRRHILDFTEFDDEEAASFGPLLRRVYAGLRSITHAKRIYQVSMMEGTAHFHAWIIPRTEDIPERGMAFLAKDLTCSDEDAARLATEVRQRSKQW
jgi:diadenosine tetraphosphate (Ap4A) HIT family hydrolase